MVSSLWADLEFFKTASMMILIRESSQCCGRPSICSNPEKDVGAGLIALDNGNYVGTKYFSRLEKDVGAGLIALDTSGACPE